MDAGNGLTRRCSPTRAGLAPKPLTEENIRNERRWGLAFEVSVMVTCVVTAGICCGCS